VKAIQKHEKALGERYEDLGRAIQAALRGGPQAGERQLVVRQGVVL